MDCYHTQQCHECHQLGIICDSFKPCCKRCSESGITCSGYSQSQPLRIRWMEPKTVSRPMPTGGKIEDPKLSKSKGKGRLSPLSKAGYERSITPHLELFDFIGEDTRALKSDLEFFHEKIWPMVNPIIRIGGNRRDGRITPGDFQGVLALPDYLRYGMISMGLSHQSTWARHDVNKKAALLSTFLRIRGIMIRSLADEIGSRDKCLDKLVFAGIMQLLSTDVSHNLHDGWRYHFRAGYRFIQLRGGLHTMTEDPSTNLLAGVFILTGVLSDSSSSSADQVMAPLDPQNLAEVTGLLTDERFVFNFYPAYIIAQILRINRLRALATTYGFPPQDLYEQACDILTRLHEFSVEEWVRRKPDMTPQSKQNHLLLGNTYKSATLLYCLYALESVSVLTSARSVASAETKRLFYLVQQALPNGQLRGYIFWPLMILGVAAVHEKLEMRNSVREWMEEYWISKGSQSALHLRNIFERFWLSGKTSWDDCFEKPYIFTFIAGAIVYFALQK